MKRLGPTLAALFLFSVACIAQQSTPPAAIQPPATLPNPEFLKAADEVLADISRIISLPVKTPLKKTVRTREEIREFILHEVREERDAAKWYADQRALETFGLIPRGFELQKFVVDLLTEQVAGLYDPKSKEFYIADWIPMFEQRMVMSHELVHALQDQHFNIEPWAEAARPNDDAELARHSVLEGSAIVGMLEYIMREQKISIRDMPDIELFIRGTMIGEVDKDSMLGKSPAYIRDSLFFPYLAGSAFTQRLIKDGGSWEKFYGIFAKPPLSTHQILHPDLYLSGETLLPVPLEAVVKAVPAEWKKLDENTLGEFGVHGLLKQFLGEDRAKGLSTAWAGDSYVIYDQQKTKQALLLFRVRLATNADAARFFGAYSESLELKYPTQAKLLRRPNFFSFETAQGGVFLYCQNDECFTAEGASRELFDRMARALGWPAAPRPPAAKSTERIAIIPQPSDSGFHAAP